MGCARLVVSFLGRIASSDEGVFGVSWIGAGEVKGRWILMRLR